MTFEYKIKDGYVVIATISGDDKKDTVNRAVREMIRLQKQGFSPAVHGIGPEEWALVDACNRHKIVVR